MPGSAALTRPYDPIPTAMRKIMVQPRSLLRYVATDWETLAEVRHAASGGFTSDVFWQDSQGKTRLITRFHARLGSATSWAERQILAHHRIPDGDWRRSATSYAPGQTGVTEAADSVTVATLRSRLAVAGQLAP